MNTYYQVSGLSKHSEEDIHGEGCQPGTSSLFDVDVSFEAETVSELIEEVTSFLGADSDNVLIDYEADKGRFDVSLYEDKHGRPASDHDLEQWRDGNKRLWHCTYTGNVERVKREPVNLNDHSLEAVTQ